MAIHLATSPACCSRWNGGFGAMWRHGRFSFTFPWATPPDLFADTSVYTTYHQYDASITSWGGLEAYVPKGPWSRTINRYTGAATGGPEFSGTGTLRSETKTASSWTRTFDVYILGSFWVAEYTVVETLTDSQTWTSAKAELDAILSEIDFDDPFVYDLAHYLIFDWGYQDSSGTIGTPPIQTGNAAVPGTGQTGYGSSWTERYAYRAVSDVPHPFTELGLGDPDRDFLRLPRYALLVGAKQRVKFPGKYRRKTYEGDYDGFQYGEPNYTSECSAVDNGCTFATVDMGPPSWSATDEFHGYKWEPGLTCS